MLPFPSTSTEWLMTAVDTLLKRTYAHPRMRGRYAGRAILECVLERAAPWERAINFKQPVGTWEQAASLVRRQLERELPVAPVEEIALTLSGITGEAGTQAGLFPDVQKDRDLRLLDAEKQIQDRIGGSHALYRVVDVAPWHPAPEMRAVQVPIDPSGRDGMKPLGTPVSVAVQEGPGHEPLAVRLGERWHAADRHRGALELRPLVDAAAGEPRLLPGEPPGRGIARPLQGPVGLLLVPAGLLTVVHPHMTTGYVELHAKSFYSFGAGASHTHELLAQAKAHGYDALALTDTNLCGALEFARLAGSLGVQPITGGEIALLDGSRIVLLAKTRQGYGNLSRLFTLANAADRREPRLDPAHLPEHAEGLVLLTGGRDGPLAKLVLDGRHDEARELLADYRSWFGGDAVYVELQQNFLQGDARRNRELSRLADEVGAPVVATNDVHYHAPERYRLQHALVAARLNTTIDRALPFIRPNHHLHLKSPDRMERLFRERPDAIASARRIAEQCSFDLGSDLGYTLPEPEVPEGYTTEGYLRRLCTEAALRRYGSVSAQVRERLDEEFRLIRKHGLAGFLLLYREIVLLAQAITEEKGLAPPETPLEERPPGRGRGSSVALLVGYLIGISHVDPLRWNLTLERFISEEMSMLPDIDLDFPRAIRDDLIARVHEHFGPEFAVLTGAVATYSVKGIIQDLGKALGLPKEDSEAPLAAAALAGRRRPPQRDAQPARLPRPRGGPGLARPHSPCSAADARPAAWDSTSAAWCSATPPSRRWCPSVRGRWTAASSWTGTRTASPTPTSPRSTSSPCRCWTRSRRRST